MRHSLQLFLTAAALLALTGCNDSELRTRVAGVESRLEAASERPPQPLPLPANAALIRETVASNLTPNQSALIALQQAAVMAPPPFIAHHEKNGDLTLSGITSVGTRDEKWIIELGFAKVGDAWEKHLTLAELPELERRTLRALTEATHARDALIVELASAKAGDVLFNSEIPQMGSLVFTGNMLDIAFADEGTPQFFFNCGPPQIWYVPGQKINADSLNYTFSRGGEIVVRNGYIYFQNHSLMKLVEKRVPPNTTHLAVSTEGAITAYDARGLPTDLGRIPIVRVKKFKAGGIIDQTDSVDDYIKEHGRGPFRPGYLEFSNVASVDKLMESAQRCNFLIALQAGLSSIQKSDVNAPESDLLPLIIHVPLSLAAEHLKALKIAVEKTNERTSVGAGADETDVANALVTVMQGLRKRIVVHQENLRNAGKTRDSDGRLNAYRRKTVAIGPQGNIVEGVDRSELPKNFKPGDPDAGADGFVVMSNVNKAVESAEFEATIEEYKLVRAALERLAPKHIFPDPPAAVDSIRANQ